MWPLSVCEESEGDVEEEHGHRVIEQPQDEDGVDAVGSAGEEEEEVGREAQGLDGVGRRERRENGGGGGGGG